MIDLHLRVRGFVSHHAWGLRLVPGERRDLGIWRLVRGSTLLGRVVFAHDRLPAAACAVEVEPMLSGPASKEALGQKQGLSWTGKTDDRGWFVVDGLLPGRYVVTARKAGFAPTRAFPVVVEEGLESEITEPLALARPLELHVKVVPPLDGMQRPWMLQLAEQGDAPNHLKTVFRQPVSDDGTFKRGGLSPGRYWARLEDNRGSRMLQHEFELTEGTTHLELRVTPVAVLGSVTLGGRPLVARLAFGGRHGSERVVMESDEDGQFSGHLPHEGRWQVDVDAGDPRVSRTLQGVLIDRVSEGAAWLELKLEGTSIEGTVVDESRRRIPGATVLVLEPSGRAVTSVVSEEDGSFAVFGVAAGRLGVQALHATREGEMASEPVAVVVAEDEPSPRVELVLRHGREITGRVVSFLGEPVAYAGVLFEVDPAELPNPSGYAQTMTDMAGGFTLRLGSSVRQGAIVVQAPGFAQRAVRWAAGEPTPVVVQVDPFGGALRVDLGALEDEVASRQRFLAVWQDGAFFAEEVLSRWAALIGQNPVTGGGRRFQRLSMGNYRVCALTLPELVGLATMQAPPPQGACDAGVIVPGGELAITLGGGSE